MSESEAARLQTLQSYRILDTPPEQDFDQLVELAAQVCSVPIALVSLIDAERQWFKARRGLEASETPRAISFCAHAIAEPHLFVVPDALQDERFAGNPLVTGEPHIRFYAGAPLSTPEGHRVGTLCVIDRSPRELSAQQAEALRILSHEVVTQLELRRTRVALDEASVQARVADAALHWSEEIKTRLIESSRDCIKVLDLEGRLLGISATGMKVLEICDLAPIRHSSWFEFWHGQDRENAQRAVERARAGGVGRFVGFFPTTQTGKPMWWDVVVTAILGRDAKPEKLLAVSRDVTEWKRAQELLRAITEGTAAVTGGDFFRSLVRQLAAGLKVQYAFVAECLPAGRARSLAFWNRDALGQDFEYDLAGTPCLSVVEGRTCFHPSRLQELFPADAGLVALRAESYLGVPLLDSARRVIGHLIVMDDRPMDDDALRLSVLETFAARAGAELERERAQDALKRALSEVEQLKERLLAENVYLQEEIRTEHNFDEIVGNSPALLEALRKVEMVARTDSTVLILGETGTGKELFARAIHSRSRRRDRPLVKVNCGAIASGLVESELFGHVKGAFTGALQKRVGRFELADGGTIFLDEVGELTLETQVKLLRVLQEQEFEPVGSSRTMRLNVRVIAATNRNLEEAVAAGKFRADLFYRLNVFPILMPPLRERKADIPLLVAFHLAGLAKKLGKPLDGMSKASMDRMTSYPWPGNVRELQNIVERAAILAQGPVLELGADLLPDLPAPARAGETARAAASAPAPSSGRTMDAVEREYMLNVLKQTRGILEGPKGAAAILGINPSTLRSRMKKLGIDRRAVDGAAHL